MKKLLIKSCLALAISSIWAPNAGGEEIIMTSAEAAALLKVTPTDVEQLAERGDLPGRKVGALGWRFSREAVIAWLSTGSAVQAASPAGTAPSATSPSEAAGPKTASADSKGTASGSPARSDLPTAEEAALRDVGLLGKPGTYTLDTRLAYTFSDAGSRSLANFGGRAESDALNVGVGLGYRIDQKTQVFLNTPFTVQRNTREDVTVGEVIKTSTARMQPIGFGLKRTLVNETDTMPQILGGIDLQVARQTDARHRIGLEVTAKKEFDPIVLFASVRGERAFGGDSSIGGHRFAAALGYVFAANDRMAVSTTLTSRVETLPDITGLGWRQVKRFDLKLGLPISLGGAGLFLEPSVSFGLNPSNGVTSVGFAVVKHLGV